MTHSVAIAPKNPRNYTRAQDSTLVLPLLVISPFLGKNQVI